jgi:ribokinase
LVLQVRQANFSFTKEATPYILNLRGSDPMFDVITVGSATRDVFLKSKEFKSKRDRSSPTGSNLPLPLGSKLNVEELIFETGGGATNTAVTFARQGLSTACICRVGDDTGGKAVVESLEKEGVNTEFTRKDSENYTAYSIILVVKNGERTILSFRGASGGFSESMFPKGKLDTKWVVITSLGGNVKLLSDLVASFKEKGTKIALIPGGGELQRGLRVLRPILAKADTVIMNREEASELTGISFDDKEKLAHRTCLLAAGIGVVTDGEAGATVCDREFFYHIGAHENKAIDRTGAGDAFASGFIVGLIKYENIEGALELAIDNSSSVVSFFGAKRGILRLGERPFSEKLPINKQKVK